MVTEHKTSEKRFYDFLFTEHKNLEEICKEGITKWSNIQSNKFPDILLRQHKTAYIIEIKTPQDINTTRLCSQIENQYDHCKYTLQNEYDCYEIYSTIVIHETHPFLKKTDIHTSNSLKTRNINDLKIYTYNDKYEFTEFKPCAKFNKNKPNGCIERKCYVVLRFDNGLDISELCNKILNLGSYHKKSHINDAINNLIKKDLCKKNNEKYYST
jgi:hypothetical protein